MKDRHPDTFLAGSPSRKQIEAQLNRLLASESFNNAARSQRFLQFVVDETLAGRQEKLHGYTIGGEVFGRSDDFDPQSDPIVRVEASRLRRRLERHYLTAGAADPVLIEIPKGSYVPSFSCRVPPRPATDPQNIAETTAVVDSPRQRRRQPATFAAVGLVLLIVLSYGSWRLIEMVRQSEPADPAASSLDVTVRTVVMPFSYESSGDPHPFVTSGMTEELIAALAALPGVEVIALGSAVQAAEDHLALEEIVRALQVDYVIRGNVRQERSRLRVSVTAIESSSSLVRLSKTYDGTDQNILDLQAEVARDLATALSVTVTPAVEEQLSAAGKRDPEALALYHQAANLRDPPSDPVRSRLAEEAYRRVIELDPEFAGGYAGLAYVLAFRSWWGMSEQPTADAEAALEAAHHAVEKDPQYGWAHMSLGIALNVAGDHDGSLDAARRAARLSPSDPHILAFSGLFQAFAGEVDAGISLTRSAIRFDPLSVRTPYRNLAGVTLFHASRFEEALEVLTENVRLGGPDGPHMAFYRAGTLSRLDRADDAQREMEKAAAFPYDFDMRELLSAFRDQREAEELLGAIEALGYDSPESQLQ